MMHTIATPILVTTLALGSSCTLGSRELGSKREAWTSLASKGEDETTFCAVAVTPDDAAVVAGELRPTGPFSQPDYPTWSGLVSRYDDRGTLAWSTRIVSSARAETTVHDIAVAPDGTIVAVGTGRDYVAGAETSSPTAETGMIFAFDPSGAQLWERLLEDTTTVSVVAARADGSFVFGGDLTTGDAVRIGMISSAGDAGPDERVFEVAPIDGASEIRDIVALPDGSAVAAIGFHDAHIVALDGSLTEVWRHSIPEYQPGIRLAVAPDDAIYVLVQGLPNNEYSRRVVNEGRIDVLAPDGRLERVIEGLEPDLRATGIGVMDGGTILLVGTVTRDTADYEIGVVAVDGESGETLWFDTAGRHGDEPFLSEDSGVDLAVAASGDAFTLGTYDDRGATGLRGWLRMYTAGGIEPQ